MPLPKEVTEKRRRAHVDYPNFWSVTDPKLVEYLNNGLYVYKGGSLDGGLGTPVQIRTSEPMDAANPLALTQFEARVQDTGLSNAITIGVCSESYPVSFLPGWHSPQGTAIGVDAAEGLLYHDTDDGLQRYVRCAAGDVMKCSVVPLSAPPGRVSIEFYHNERLVTTEAADVPDGGFYGVIGLASPREAVIIGPPQREEIASFDSLYELKSNYIAHKGDGVCEYVVPRYSTHADEIYVGTLRSIRPVEPGECFKVRLLDKGEDSAIAIGMSSSDYPIDRLPGWDEDSLAYHLDISSILNGKPSEREPVSGWAEGEILSCQVEAIDGSTKELRVVFRKDGDIIWKSKLWNPIGGFYWNLSMLSSNERVQVILPRRIVPLYMPRSRFEDIWQLPLPSVEYTQNGICLYIGRGGHSEIGIVRSRVPIDPLDPFPFFDVKIVNPGMFGQITLGVCSSTYSPVEMPGWKPKSIGFQCDTGNIYQNSEFPQKTDHPCSQGDVIRCTVSPVDGSNKRVAISFHRNGVLIDKAMEWTPPGGFYAQIGMMSEHEIVQIACPSMNPSSLKQGLTGFDSQLTKRVRSVTAPVGMTKPVHVHKTPSPYQMLPLHHTPPRSSDHHDGPGEYSYVPPASPIVSRDTEKDGKPLLRQQYTAPVVPGTQRRESYPTGTRSRQGDSGGFRRYNQHSEPAFHSSSSGSSIDVTPPDSRLVTPSEESRAPLSTVSPIKPAYQSTTPTQSTTPILSTTPIQQVSAPIFCVPEEEEVAEPVPLPEISKSDNRLFRCLHKVLYAEDTGELTVSDTLNETKYCYAVRRQAMTEKMSYFEVDLLSNITQGVAVGLSIGTVFDDQLLGTYSNTLSLSTSTGSLYSGTSEPVAEVTTSFRQGDTIGCGITILSDSSHRPEDSKNSFVPPKLKVEFYKNAEHVGEMTVPLPMASLYPTLCFLEPRSHVKFKCEYKMKPIDYFESHPIPEGYRNFPMPPFPPTDSGWIVSQQERQCDFTLEGRSTKVSISPEVRGRDKPLLIQHHLSFSRSDKYFEMELAAPANSYSIVCVGAMPRIDQKSDSILPGEKGGGVGFFPLTGLIMRNGDVVSYIMDEMVSNAVAYRSGLKVGIGMEMIPSSANVRSVLLFFTINSQEISKLLCTVPLDGLFPTVAIQSKVSQLPIIDQTVCHLLFPCVWPCCDLSLAPWAVAKISPDIEGFNSTFVFIPSTPESKNTTKGVQACYALSPSRPYYEVVVLREEFRISIGLAPLLHPLDVHVGLGRDSIGYHIDKGGVFHNGLKLVATPINAYSGVRIGCGAVFPEDGSLGSAEVFFTINGVLVFRHLVQVPASGLFPTMCMVNGMLSLALDSSHPFPGMKFSSQWAVLDNVLATGQMIQLVSHAHIGLAQLARFAVPQEIIYFKVRLPSSFDAGKVFTGFSNCADSPFTPKVSGMNHSFYIELSSGTIITIQNGQRRSADCPIPKSTSEIGCGISPISNSHSSLLFFTADNQIIYTLTTSLLQVQLHPTVCMVGSLSKIKVNTCSLWPPVSPVGFGWGRYNAAALVDSCIVPRPVASVSTKCEIGFIQSSTPIIPSQSYFEVEILKRDPKKSIGIGLASNQYSQLQWVGWKSESIGYHLDDGKMYKANGMGTTFGPKLFQGDIIGCGMRIPSDSSVASLVGTRHEVFFTINGHCLPKTELMTIPAGGLFPTVCLESSSESVCIHLKGQCPSGINRLSRDWSRSYCVSQAGNHLEHSFHLKDLKMAVAEGYCQSREPLTPRYNYYEVEILSHGERSNLSIGLAPLQPLNSRKLVTDYVLFTVSGQVLALDAGRQMATPTRQKCEVGDRIGCRLKVSNNQHLVEFCRNGIKVMFTTIPNSLQDVPLHATIILSKPEDSVVPLLRAPPPSNTIIQHIGWLRSERVKTRGSVVEYTGLGLESPRSVGVAQMSQPLGRQNSYYEIEVIDPGAHCTIGIGAAALDHPMNRQPGWTSASIGHHGDDGRLFYESGFGCGFGPPWKRHDVIGLGVRPYTADMGPGSSVQVFITHNGQEIGHTTCEVPSSGLFPTVGLHSKGERIKVCHNVYQSNVSVRSYLRWRTIVGMKFEYSHRKQRDILTYLDRPRSVPPGLDDPLGIAIGSEPFSDKLVYFEVELLNIGQLNAIAIGAAHKNYSPNCVPGWYEGSVAYHTDSGCLHHASGKGREFGPIARKGDVIGCGLSISGTHCSVFFTYNGVQIGHRVQATVPSGGFFPTVGFVSPGDKVTVRFMDTFKPLAGASESIVGLMRIQNSSYSDHLLSFHSGISSSLATAQFAVALNTNRNYYSANIVKMNDSIRIGLAPRDYPLTHSPGMFSYSVAYDATDGIVRGVFGRSVKTRGASKCAEGDTVGCGVTLIEAGSNDKKKSTYYVFFTRNGIAFHQMELPDLCDDLFPIVGFVPNEKNSAVYMDWSVSSFEPQNVL